MPSRADIVAEILIGALNRAAKEDPAVAYELALMQAASDGMLVPVHALHQAAFVRARADGRRSAMNPAARRGTGTGRRARRSTK